MQLQGESTYIRHIHRLDKETSGVILFAKHSLAGAILDTALAQRSIKRTYMALVHGQLKVNMIVLNSQSERIAIIPISGESQLQGNMPKRPMTSKLMIAKKYFTHYLSTRYRQNPSNSCPFKSYRTSTRW